MDGWGVSLRGGGHAVTTTVRHRFNSHPVTGTPFERCPRSNETGGCYLKEHALIIMAYAK